MVRMIATTRVVLPRTAVRLSAGRQEMSLEGQALCFMAGANSIFAGEKLLTTPNPDFNEDMEMFKILGLQPKAAYTEGEKPISYPDPIIDARKLKEAERAAALLAAKQTGFEPRKVTSVQNL